MKDSKPTSLDIAHLAGVSQPTVSRALRNSPLVSKETREKIQAIARELNYKVDVNASNLRSQSTKTLALLLCEDPGDSMINPFFLSMLGSITRAAAKEGYDLLVSFQQLSEDWRADYEDANKANGIIFLGYGDYTQYIDRISRLDQAGAHFITWGPVVPGQPGHFLGCDNTLGAYEATQHLIQLGRKHIAFIGDTSDDCPEFQDRYRGYLKALSEHGLKYNQQLHASANSTETMGFDATQTILERTEPFDSVFCCSDLMAIGTIQCLRENGYSVPDDIAVVGFDDIPTASHMTPPLTTVQQDTIKAGELLVENILSLINGEHIESRLLPPQLIIRKSCGS
ncbi:LacI family DNA-binding transcriptional regulator [Marinibactrum halimedae]|uniref:LacI family transcriptional regulator n=1 Tax=Marinibactrum halimedae TaxID=1444977 RepID=A0AA37T437_9GAMM|nr:LacI family DNA-binding transcriptional regulator [Marinibactrum halimedae]MCD9459135.1 LacI family DNA-binding transcriptional regulator [Marinibactrum halimedae]GLS24737.1 LacI family transcriptional regulator [Marinibactrum halimedae]